MVTLKALPPTTWWRWGEPMRPGFTRLRHGSRSVTVPCPGWPSPLIATRSLPRPVGGRHPPIRVLLDRGSPFSGRTCNLRVQALDDEL